MTVNEVYQLVQYILNKEQMGDLSPEEFNLSAAQAERMYLSYLLGNTEEYQQGRAIARVELGSNGDILQRLHFLVSPLTPINVVSQVGAYPSDFEAVVALYTTNMSKIRFVQQDRLANQLGSVIDPIASNPIYTFQNNGFLFFPSNLTSALISYIKTPQYMVWGFTVDGNALPVYNQNTSIQPKWLEADMMNIIYRILRMAGVNLQNNVVNQYANDLKMTGQ